MSLTKRFNGDFTMESIDSGNKIIMSSGENGNVTIDTTTNKQIIFVSAITIGTVYHIESVGTTDFTTIGSADNEIGTEFTATGTDAGTGTVSAVRGVTILGDLRVTGTHTSIGVVDLEVADNTIVLNAGETGTGVDNGTGEAGIEIDRGLALPAGIRFNESTDIWETNPGNGTWTAIVTGAGYELVTDLSPQLGGDLDVNGWNIVSTSASDGTTGPNGTDVAIAPVTGGNVSVSTIDGNVLLTTNTTGHILLTSALDTTITAGLDATFTAAGTATISSTAADIAITATTDIVLSTAAGLIKVDQELSLKEGTPPLPGSGAGTYNQISAGTAGTAGTGLYFVNDTFTDELVSKRAAIKYSLIF